MEHFENFKHRFSETAEKILKDTEQIARSLNSEITTEHLLIAIASNPGTLAFEVLRDALIEPQKIAKLSARRSTRTSNLPAITDALKKILKNA